MTDERAVPNELLTQDTDSLAQISRSDFIAGWKALVGEPPAAMLDDRAAMIRALVESIPGVPLASRPPAQADPAEFPRSRTASGFG